MAWALAKDTAGSDRIVTGSGGAGAVAPDLPTQRPDLRLAGLPEVSLPTMVRAFAKVTAGGDRIVTGSGRAGAVAPDLTAQRPSLPPAVLPEVSLPTMVQATLRYSAGKCEAFPGELVSDDTLLIVAQRLSTPKAGLLHQVF